MERKNKIAYLRLLDHFHTHTSEFTSLLGEMVSYQTHSGECDHINGFADYLTTLFAQLGPTVRRIPTPAGDILELTFPDTTDASPVLLAHMDTVKVSSEAPAARLEGGRLYGSGCYDMKNGIAIFYFTAQTLYQTRLATGTGLKILFTPDEETGSRESLPFIHESCRGSRGVILPEPSCHDGALKSRRKGVATIEASLCGQAAHSGIEPEKGRDANRALARLIREIDAGLREIGDVSFNPGIITGGVRTNVVSPSSSLQGELRSFSNEKLRAAGEWITALNQIDGITIQTAIRLMHPALEADDKNNRLGDIARAIAAELGKHLEAGSSGGASDGSSLSAQGIPVIDGLGMRGGGAHSPEEYVEVEDFPFRACLITGLCTEI